MHDMQSDIYKILADLSDIDLHWFYIQVKSRSLVWLYTPPQTKEEKISIILNQLPVINLGGTSKQEVINMLSLRDSAKEYQKHTNWIDAKNNRLCVYLWLFAIKYIPPEFPRNADGSIIQVSPSERTQPYWLLEMPLGPTSSSECLQWFDDYFYVLLSKSSLKIDLLNLIRFEWEKKFSFKHKMLKVLQKNESDEEVTSWFWNYMQFSDLSYSNRFNFDSFTDKLSLIFGMINTMPFSDAEITIKLDKAYTAYHSKKFKKKPQNMKGDTFWLGSQDLRMLNSLSIRNKLSDKDCLRKLIHDAYLKIEK